MRISGETMSRFWATGENLEKNTKYHLRISRNIKDFRKQYTGPIAKRFLDAYGPPKIGALRWAGFRLAVNRIYIALEKNLKVIEISHFSVQNDEQFASNSGQSDEKNFPYLYNMLR